MRALLLFAAGCGGAMGQTQMAGGGATDKGGLTSALDAPLASGAEVRPAFQFRIEGSAAPPTHLVSLRNDIVEVKNGLIVGKGSGVTAVLVALDGTDTVIDFLHVWVRPTDRIEVHAVDGAAGDLGPVTEPIELVAGDGMRLVPHPYAGSERLVGVATSAWTVEPPIAVVLREGLPNRVHLVARTPGTATVKVAMLGASSTIKLKVVP